MPKRRSRSIDNKSRYEYLFSMELKPKEGVLSQGDAGEEPGECRVEPEEGRVELEEGRKEPEIDGRFWKLTEGLDWAREAELELDSVVYKGGPINL